MISLINANNQIVNLLKFIIISYLLNINGLFNLIHYPMKTRQFNLAILFLLALSNLVSAQIKTDVVTIDLGIPSEKSVVSTNDKIKKLVIPTRRLLVIKLENGNPFKYRYIINNRLIDFFSDQGQGLTDTLRKSIEKSGFEKSRQERIHINADTAKNNYNTRAKNALEIIKKYHSLLEQLAINDLIPTKEKEDSIIISNAFEILNYLMGKNNSEITSFILKSSMEDYLNVQDFKSQRDNYYYQYIETKYYVKQLENEALKFYKLEKTFTSTVGNLDKLSEEVEEKVTRLFDLKFDNYIIPIDFNGKNIDLIEVTVERYDINATNPSPDRYTYNIWVRGGFKIDVSGGLFITSLVDKEYFTKDVMVNENGVDVTYKKIYENNKGGMNFGFGSVINTTIRSGSWVRFSLSTGALITDKQKTQILTGLGVMLGRETRIILHGGCTMGFISVINDEYAADGTIQYNLGTAGQIPTTSKFSVGYFLGITSNFGNVKSLDDTKLIKK